MLAELPGDSNGRSRPVDTTGPPLAAAAQTAAWRPHRPRRAGNRERLEPAPPSVRHRRPPDGQGCYESVPTLRVLKSRYPHVDTAPPERGAVGTHSTAA